MKILTIAIPTYQRLDRIKVCIESLDLEFKDTASQIEVVVSDNCSQDGTWAFLSEWTFTNPLITFKPIRNTKNVGSVSNCKEIVRNSSGDYILWCTDDDYFLPGASQIILGALEKYMVEYCKFSMISYLEISKTANYYGRKFDLENTSQSVTNFLEIFNSAHVLTGTMISQKVANKWLELETDNCYPSLVWCALSEHSRVYVAGPAFMHIWENEIFWDLDVKKDPKGSTVKFLQKSEQEALLFALNEILESQQSSLVRAEFKKLDKPLIPELDNLLEELNFNQTIKLFLKNSMRKKIMELRRIKTKIDTFLIH